MSIAKRFVDLLSGLSESNGSLSFGESVTQALQKAKLKIPSDSPEVCVQMLWSVCFDANRSKVQSSSEITEDNAMSSTKRSKQAKAHNSVDLDSSPVVQANDNPTTSSEEQGQVDVRPSGVQSADEPSFVPESIPLPADADRDRMFSMIEGLRSSSPVNTPQQFEFRTPPHLRHVSRGAHDAEPPLTPTLAAVSAENYDIFLGSSPTPGTRTKPKAAAPRPSSQKGKEAKALTTEDPPSSPPDVKSPTPGDNREPEVSSQHDAENDGLANSTPVKKNVPRRQTRSASKKSTPKTDHSGDATADSAPQEVQDEAAQARNGKPNTRRKASASKMPPKGQRPQDEKANEDPVPHDADNDNADFSNDDVESQIATQLEQDLEFAVDHNVVPDAGIEQVEPAASLPSSKKRKRDVDDAQTPPRQDKRRSTRLSSSQQPVMDSSPGMDMTPEPRSTRSKKSRASQPSQDAPVPEPSPAQTSAKKQKSQPKADEQEPRPTESEQTETQPVSQIEETQQPVEHNASTGLEVPEPSQGRRRSSRRSRQSSSAIPEIQSPNPEKSPQPSRSRKQEAAQETSQETSQANKPEDQVQQRLDAAETVTEAASRDNAKEPEVSEQAVTTDIQMSQSDGQAEQVPMETDIEMGDVEAAPAEPESRPELEPEPTTEEPTVSSEEKTSQTTQTEQPSSTSDTGIIRAFEQTLDSLKSATLDESKFREVDELLFRIRIEAQDAFRRHGAITTSKSSTS